MFFGCAIRSHDVKCAREGTRRNLCVKPSALSRATDEGTFPIIHAGFLNECLRLSIEDSSVFLGISAPASPPRDLHCIASKNLLLELRVSIQSSTERSIFREACVCFTCLTFAFLNTAISSNKSFDCVYCVSPFRIRINSRVHPCFSKCRGQCDRSAGRVGALSEERNVNAFSQDGFLSLSNAGADAFAIGLRERCQARHGKC